MPQNYLDFRLRTSIEPELPDGRLHSVELECKDSGIIAVRSGIITIHWREGHFSEEVMRDLAEYVRHMVHAKFFTQEEDGTIACTAGTHLWEGYSTPRIGRFEIGMDRADEEVLGLSACRIKLTPTTLTWVVQKNLVTQDLVKEYNEEVPRLGFLSKIWEKPEVSLLDLLEDQ
jgi:hypothetical protein